MTSAVLVEFVEKKCRTRTMLFSEAAILLVSSSPEFQRITKGTHGDGLMGRGWNEHKITNICARRSTWFTLLATMASFSSDKFSPKKNSLKDVQGYIHGISMSRHQPTPTRQGILTLFCKKETGRGELFASM